MVKTKISMRAVLLCLIAVAFLFLSATDAICKDEGAYRISIMSAHNPNSVNVHSTDGKTLVLAVNEELYPDYAATKDDHFRVTMGRDGIEVSVMKGPDRQLMKKTTSKDAKISFVTKEKKQTYNKYTIETDNGTKEDFEGTINISYADTKIFMLLFVQKETVLAELINKDAANYKSAEGLKAQAVLARTILQLFVGSHGLGKFDLCDSEHCSVYMNREKVSKRALRAARETSGKVMTHKGKLVYPYFFNTCGGHTVLASTSWGMSDTVLPYIKAVKCDYCRNSKNYRFKKEIKRDVLSRIFLGKDDESFDIKVTKYGKHNHWINSINVITDTYGYAVTGTKFMKLLWGALDEENLPSGAFSVKKKGEKFVFSGKGAGHGVGLCQTGADKMGNKGHSYKKILKFYFSKIKIKDVSSL